MADINVVKQNIQKMIDMGAPESDIDEYVSSEGVSIDQLQTPAKEESTLASDVATAGVAAAGAGALYAGQRVFNAPKRLVDVKEKELKNIKTKYLNEPLIASQDIPARIQDKMTTETQPLRTKIASESQKISSAQLNSAQASAQIKRALDDFDNNIMSQSVNDLTTSLIENEDKFFNGTYNNYGKVIDGAEETLTKAGKQLDSEAFLNNVIQKSMQEATASGVLPENMGKISSFANKISQAGESAIIDAESKPFIMKQPMTVRQLGGYVRNLSNGAPKELAMTLRKNWGSLLEASDEGIARDIGDANRDYTKFYKIRTALYKTIGNAGEFKKDSLARFVKAYAQSNVENGLQEIVNLMAKGQGVIASTPDVGKAFGKIRGNKAVRSAIEVSGSTAQSMSEGVVSRATKEIQDIESKIDAIKTKSMQMADTAERVLSEQKAIETKYPLRSGGLLKAFGKLAGVARNASVASIARKSLGAFAPYMMIRDAVNGISDPKKYLADQLGVEMPERGTKDRAVLEQFFDTQDKMRGVGKDKTPEELGVSDEEKASILYKYGLAI